MAAQYIKKVFMVNKYLTLKLVGGTTQIYVNDMKFMQCKFLLLTNPHKDKRLELIESIDEAAEVLNKGLELQLTPKRLGLSKEQEFWGHCSNLQSWAEYNYDTRLLHSNLSFPLLKALDQAGDPKARKVFKEEIALRFLSNYYPVSQFLANEGYLFFLNRTELLTLYEQYKLVVKGEKTEPNKARKIDLWYAFAAYFLQKFMYLDALTVLEESMETYPNDEKIWKMFEKVVKNLHKSDGPYFPSYLSLAEINPDNISFWKGLGYYYFFKKEYKRSVRAFEKVSTFENHSVCCRLFLIESYLRSGNIEKSIIHSKKLISEYPNKISYKIKLAMVYLQTTFPKITFLEISKNSIVPTHLNSTKRTQKSKIEYRKYLSKAIEKFEKLSKRFPRNLGIRSLLTHLYIYTHDISNIIKSLLIIIDDYPKEKSKERDFWGFFFTSIKPRKAISICKTIIRYRPEEEFLWSFLVNLYLIIDQVKKSIETCQRALSIHPKANHLFELLGELYIYGKQYHKARKILEKIVEKTPKKIDVLNKLSEIYIKLSFFKNAFIVLNQALKFESRKNLTWQNLGSLYYKQKQYKKAARRFKKSLKIFNGSSLCYYYLAKTYVNLDRLEDALQAITTCILISPQFEKFRKTRKKIVKILNKQPTTFNKRISRVA
ncbi:MAG: tetratricopeptide repeat protein [Candidatus Lokiarchaeota archaeon]|nr:tetratricopeptide repeat protein [Candidatus Lokiarchaeota archaeon]MBD3337894.1 tetratricopeptide repeat protein [Candidatus Lokiarchaeota archaeon]